MQYNSLIRSPQNYHKDHFAYEKSIYRADTNKSVGTLILLNSYSWKLGIMLFHFQVNFQDLSIIQAVRE